MLDRLKEAMPSSSGFTDGFRQAGDDLADRVGEENFDSVEYTVTYEGETHDLLVKPAESRIPFHEAVWVQVDQHDPVKVNGTGDKGWEPLLKAVVHQHREIGCDCHGY